MSSLYGHTDSKMLDMEGKEEKFQVNRCSYSESEFSTLRSFSSLELSRYDKLGVFKQHMNLTRLP